MAPDARYDAHAGWYDDWIADPAEDPVAQPLFRVVGDVTPFFLITRGRKISEHATTQ